MSAAAKMLDLLPYFTTDLPQIGLSQLCKLAGRDKATTHRHLQILENAGFVEQNPVDKKYRLGPALLQLAHVRELTVPRKSGVEDPLRLLSEQTGETAHATVLSGKTLYKLLVCESVRHSIRVTIDIQTFPLHATASGLCALAFGPPELLALAQTDMRGFTHRTITDPDALHAALDVIRQGGFSVSPGGYEEDVISYAVPLFDRAEGFAGTVTVASVAARWSTALEQNIKTNLIAASREITRNWGGTIPAPLEAGWANSLSSTQRMDVAS